LVRLYILVDRKEIVNYVVLAQEKESEFRCLEDYSMSTPLAPIFVCDSIL